MSSQPHASKPYPEVSAQANFPQIEVEILARWEAEGTFRKSVEQRAAGPNEYVFYDGPPFANGLPHYGHLLTGYVKDVVPRYQTMRGRRVERRFGWDCHGLPAEMEAEKELKVSGREADPCLRHRQVQRSLPQERAEVHGEWRNYVTRQARWVDFDNDYKTMDLSYMESVLWAFQQLYKKGLVYEGHRVMPYSWAMQTPVSNHETRMDDATRPRQDPAITIAFTLHAREGRQRVRWCWRRSAHPGLDDHAVDVAEQPGTRGRPGHRLLGPAKGWVCATCSARRRSPTTARSSRASKPSAA
jgi:isoleucyl-tRNA synthetase